MPIRLDDSRRLTGPNLYWDKAGAVIDLEIQGITGAEIIQVWQPQIRSFLDAVGWSQEQFCSRSYSGGLSLVISAPIDVLYAATEVNEAAWAAAHAQLGGPAAPAFKAEVQRLRRLIAEEAKPDLLALQAAAVERGVGFLWDDDEVSVGYGAGCLSWPMEQLPQVSQVPWEQVSAIPLALVTGTNGKSTSVRLAAAVMQAAGLNCGLTSTDFIRVGDEIIDSGDYSGPGGARTLLRHPRAEVAILEVARGGLLRRGLGVNAADVALITNVSADHLGEYGINTVPELIQAKFIVSRALRQEQPLVLNADDPGVVAYAAGLQQKIVWFSEDPENPVIKAALQQGSPVVLDQAGWITWRDASESIAIADLRQIPISMNGNARHNVQNALAVAALCMVLNVDPEHINQGMQRFASSPADNPGRGNMFRGNGISVLVDFAHNEHGLSAVASTLNNMPARRRLVLMGQAGDRSDELIRDLVRAAMRARPDCLVICGLPGYERGRDKGAVPALIRDCALEFGMQADQLILADDPETGTQAALQWAQPGDYLLLLALSQREQVLAQVQEFCGRGASLE